MNDDNHIFTLDEDRSSPAAADDSYSRPQESAYHYGRSQTQEDVWTGYTQPQANTQTQKPRRSMSAGSIVALCLVCAILAAALGAGGAYLLLRQNTGSAGSAAAPAVTTPVPVITTTTSEGAVNETAAYVYELAKQQVVGVSTEISYYNIFGQSSAASVTGSGVIISEDGYILTNYHVIEDAYKGGYQVTVMMYDETTYDAEIVGFESDNDIALLKIDAQGLNAAELGNSDDLTVGQIVYAVGNPLGQLSYTMTSGIVSATNRTITTEQNVAMTMFQIDAPVNSGNSGGPVYNTTGQVIGIVSAKYSSTGVEGIGFAIPISEAAHIANQILEYGYVKDKASLGITAATVTSSIAQYYNMTEGAYVNEINAGSAAEKAGLRVGDIITALDGETVAGSSELTTMIKQYHAGDEAELTVWRGGETLTLSVVFDEKLPQEDVGLQSANELPQNGQPGQFYSGDMEDFFRQFFGFGF